MGHIVNPKNSSQSTKDDTTTLIKRDNMFLVINCVPLIQRCFGQDGLKLALWFWRRLLNFTNVFFPFFIIYR